MQEKMRNGKKKGYLRILFILTIFLKINFPFIKEFSSQ